MAASNIVRLAMHAVGEVETGLWCDACALQSVVGMDFVVEMNDTPQDVRFMGACEECGRRGHR